MLAARAFARCAILLEALADALSSAPGAEPGVAASHALARITSFLAMRADELAADPPRMDYRVATRSVRRPLEVGVFNALAHPEPWLASARAVNRAEADIAGFVRALERAQGARLSE